MADLWVAAILGVVEGLTEFLPVSSTGHLIVAGHLLGCSGEKMACFEVFIQLGAILAVVVLYWRRFMGLIPTKGFSPSAYRGFDGTRGISLLILTTLPALVIGYLTHRLIKTYLFGPATVAWALALGGVAILLAERYKPESRAQDVGEMTYSQAFLIGLFQCVSMWPGVSRAAATIIGGLLCGLDRKSATEYSFLAAVPVMIAATSYDLLKTWKLLDASDFTFFAVGFVVSFVTAAAAVKTFITLVQRWSLAPYAYYRIAIAPLIYWFLQ
ncbi:MAG: undecaprenyl-diphosphate phosphatase [Thermodesulfobacteriota bacterium]